MNRTKILLSVAGAASVALFADRADACFTNFQKVSLSSSGTKIQVKVPSIDFYSCNGAKVWVAASLYHQSSAPVWSGWTYWNINHDSATTTAPLTAVIETGNLGTQSNVNLYLEAIVEKNGEQQYGNYLPVGQAKIKAGKPHDLRYFVVTLLSGRTFGWGAAAYGQAMGWTYTYVYNSRTDCLEFVSDVVMSNGQTSHREGCAVLGSGTLSECSNGQCDPPDAITVYINGYYVKAHDSTMTKWFALQ